MNRKIKFRAWDGKTKKIYYGDMIFLNTFSDGGSMSLNSTIKSIQNDLKLMQYIGLTDKSGKEIYVGDIIECKSYKGEYSKGEVKFIVDNNNCESGYTFGSIGWQNNEIEIIGNIYENPEILN